MNLTTWLTPSFYLDEVNTISYLIVKGYVLADFSILNRADVFINRFTRHICYFNLHFWGISNARNISGYRKRSIIRVWMDAEGRYLSRLRYIPVGGIVIRSKPVQAYAAFSRRTIAGPCTSGNGLRINTDGTQVRRER